MCEEPLSIWGTCCPECLSSLVVTEEKELENKHIEKSWRYVCLECRFKWIIEHKKEVFYRWYPLRES